MHSIQTFRAAVSSQSTHLYNILLFPCNIIVVFDVKYLYNIILYKPLNVWFVNHGKPKNGN